MYGERVCAWVSKGCTFNNEKKSRFMTIPSSPSQLTAVSKLRYEENKSEHISNFSSRRFFLEESLHILLLPAATLGLPLPADAKYGSGTSMELPSYIDYLIEKNTAADNSEALYTGADPATVLKRLAESERRLGEVGELAEKKKWSQINGLITGPLGTLSSTMNQIVSVVSSSKNQKKTKEVEKAVKKVKADIFAIGQAADRKNAEGCMQQAQTASGDLKVLLEIAFE